MDIVNQTCLDVSFCSAFFSALETDRLAPDDLTIADRIAATRLEIAGMARCQERLEGERIPNNE